MDLTGGTSSVDTGYQSQSDLLVQTYKQAQQSSVNALKLKQTTLESKQLFFNQLKTKLNSLTSAIDTFTADNASSKFITRSINSSDKTVLTASATSDAMTGVHFVKVNRLATNDLLVSKQLNLEDTIPHDAGTYKMNFVINGENKEISVTFDGTENNEQGMTKIVNAINNFNYTNDDDDVDINASIVKDTTSTGRITFTSSKTGADYRISFENGGIFNALGITTSALNPDSTSRTSTAGNDAFYQASDYNELNSEAIINGITVKRNSNTIDDVMNGVTFSLLKPQDADEQPVTMTTTVNRSAVESLINPILTAYNDALKFLKQDPTISRGDSAVSSLFSRLRGLSTEAITSVGDNSPKYLTEIGIKIGTDGTLSINDTDKLQDFLETNPQKVADLFTSADGFAKKIESATANLVGTDGLISARTKSLGSQIDSTKTRITTLEDKIDRQANALRKEYESMLEVYLQAQSQYDLLSSMNTTTS